MIYSVAYRSLHFTLFYKDHIVIWQIHDTITDYEDLIILKIQSFKNIISTRTSQW